MKNRVLTAFRLPQEHTKAIADMAKTKGITKTQAVETLLNAGLRNMKTSPQ